MKIRIKADCTAAEARELMGLPDVKELQEAWLRKVEAKMMEEAEKFTPEKIMESWTAGASSNMDMFSGLMNAFGQPGKTK